MVQKELKQFKTFFFPPSLRGPQVVLMITNIDDTGRLAEIYFFWSRRKISVTLCFPSFAGRVTCLALPVVFSLV